MQGNRVMKIRLQRRDGLLDRIERADRVVTHIDVLSPVVVRWRSYVLHVRVEGVGLYRSRRVGEGHRG